MSTPAFIVHLGHEPNPDIRNGGYWGGIAPSENNLKEPANTLEAASRLCTQFIAKHDLGGSNWTGGQVYRGKKQVAQVSYNGRVWEPSKRGSLDAEEITGAALQDHDFGKAKKGLLPKGTSANIRTTLMGVHTANIGKSLHWAEIVEYVKARLVIADWRDVRAGMYSLAQECSMFRRTDDLANEIYVCVDNRPRKSKKKEVGK